MVCTIDNYAKAGCGVQWLIFLLLSVNGLRSICKWEYTLFSGNLSLVFSLIFCGIQKVHHYLGETLAFHAIGIGLGQCSFVWHEISSSNISKTVWPRITKFDGDIHTDIVYSHIGYDVIIYFQSEVTGESSRQCRLWRLQVKFLENSSS